MVYRYSWLAGIGAIGFGLWRLARLLESTSSGVAWQLVILAAVVVGAVVTWAGVAYRLKAGWIALLNVVLFVIAVARYGAPDTGYWILPDRESASVIGAEISRALDIIRHGIEPVDPLPGLVIVVGALFWGLGALLVYGLLKERPFLALIPPLVVGLQLLTIERQPSSNLEIALFVLLVAGAALAVGLDEHDRGAGRMTTQGQQARRFRGPLSRSAFVAVLVTVVAAIGVSSALAGRIPADGIMSWRAPGSLASGVYGGVSYDPYVEIYRGLVSQTGRSLFTAQLDGPAIANGTLDTNDVYYRLVTLDSYADGRWSWAQDRLVPADDEEFDEGNEAYAGPNEEVTASVTIHNLRQDWLPAPYSVRSVAGEDAEAFQIRESDASVHYRRRTYRNMRYEVVADVPVVDSGAVARGPDGSLYPSFQVASEEGRAIPAPVSATEHRELPDPGRYLGLPDDFDEEVVALAEDLTRGLSDFEKGLALEYWFREGGNFEYTLAVDRSRGHGPDALAAWLLDTSEENQFFYRRGYCEQFATSMGVMARAVGIPSRVVLGFLPGEEVATNEVLVRDIYGHSWVELWIPSQGWMRFDPTPRDDGVNPNAAYTNVSADLGFDIADYLEAAREFPDEDAGTPLGAELEQELRLPEADLLDDSAVGAQPTSNFGAVVSAISRVVLVLLLLAAPLIGGIPAVKWVRRKARVRRLERGDIGAAWDVIVAELADLDRPVDASATPMEVAADVGVALEPLASVYTKSIYSQEQTPTERDVYTAIRSMSVTKDRLLIDLPPGERIRSTYRLASFGTGSFSRWLPWLRP